MIIDHWSMIVERALDVMHMWCNPCPQVPIIVFDVSHRPHITNQISYMIGIMLCGKSPAEELSFNLHYFHHFELLLASGSPPDRQDIENWSWGWPQKWKIIFLDSILSRFRGFVKSRSEWCHGCCHGRGHSHCHSCCHGCRRGRGLSRAEIQNPKPKIQNPKSQTQNPKSKSQHPKHRYQTPKIKIKNGWLPSKMIQACNLLSKMRVF